MSPIGGLLQPSGFHDDFGVEVRCNAPGQGARPLLVPVSPGLYGHAHVEGARKLALGERTEVEGPGLLAFDGDRTRVLAAGERASLWVERAGPWVIEAERALRAAGADGVYTDRHWHYGLKKGAGPGCC
jgi:hypothetical protein